MYDLVIIGGGLTAATLTHALSNKVTKRPMKVAVLAPKTPNYQGEIRNFAISAGSKIILEEFLIWSSFTAPEPIRDIYVYERNLPYPLHFSEKLAGQELGYIVPAVEIWRALLANFSFNSSTSQESPFVNSDHHQGSDFKCHKFDFFLSADYTIANYQNYAEITLSDHQVLKTQIAALAGGRNTQWKNLNYNYKQLAIVCNIYHSEPHQSAAIEKFFSDGPIASLPMPSEGEKHCSQVIWTSTDGELLMLLDEEQFRQELQLRLGFILGDVKLASARISHPAHLSWTYKLHRNRIVLLGDAAHSIHPVAGQGFNLSLRDIRAFVEIVSHYHSLGLDLKSCLQSYSKSRLPDLIKLVAATHLTVNAFSSKLLKALRFPGLFLINNNDHIKGFLMRSAMGLI